MTKNKKREIIDFNDKPAKNDRNNNAKKNEKRDIKNKWHWHLINALTIVTIIAPISAFCFSFIQDSIQTKKDFNTQITEWLKQWWFWRSLSA